MDIYTCCLLACVGAMSECVPAVVHDSTRHTAFVIPTQPCHGTKSPQVRSLELAPRSKATVSILQGVTAIPLAQFPPPPRKSSSQGTRYPLSNPPGQRPDTEAWFQLRKATAPKSLDRRGSVGAAAKARTCTQKRLF